MPQPTSMRLSDTTAAQLKDLADRYGNQTTALTVAIDRLWRDTVRETYYLMDHRKTGETYALALDASGKIIGYHGPLDYREVAAMTTYDLHYLDYERDDAAVDWANGEQWRWYAPAG